MNIQNELKIIESDINIQEKQLRILLNDTTGLRFLPANLEERTLDSKYDSAQLSGNPMLAYAKQQINIANAEKAVQTAKMLPDLSVGYFNFSQIGNLTASGDVAGASNRFTGVQAGISIPLFYGSYKSGIKSAKLRETIAQTNAEYSPKLCPAIILGFIFDLTCHKRHKATLAVNNAGCVTCV